MRKQWNAATDVWECYFSENDIEEAIAAGFEEAASDWLLDPTATLSRRLPYLSEFDTIAGTLRSFAASNDVQLFSVTKEHADRAHAFLVVFGSEMPAVTRRYPVFLQLGIQGADWKRLEEIGFDCPPRFREFTETFAGLCLGAVQYPPVLSPPSVWHCAEEFFGESHAGRVLIPEVLRGRCEEFLAIQLNYYGILTLLSKTGELWLAHCGGAGAAPAKISLDDWIDAELRGRHQPQGVD